MFRQLRCSFCRRHADEVAKLVAGPRAFICDRCIAIATEMMNAPVDPDQRAAAPRGPLRTWKQWFKARSTSHRTAEVLQ